MILSILIPTLPERDAMLQTLVDEIISQSQYLLAALQTDKVEILTDTRPRGTVTTGQKRNDLIARATGLYTWFIDDDDMILPHSLPAILHACKNDADVICIDGFMTTDNNPASRVPFEMRLGHPYKSATRNGKEIYLRPPNHLCPIKRSIALQVPFSNKNVQEDYEYCMQLAALGLCKTQHIIPTPVYHYRYVSKK